MRIHNDLVSIVSSFAKLLRLLEECVQNVKSTVPRKHEVITIADNSDEDAPRYLFLFTGMLQG